MAVDEFQHFVYENPEITHEERCAKWREIEKKHLPHKKYDHTPVLEKGGYLLNCFNIIVIFYIFITAISFFKFLESKVDI